MIELIILNLLMLAALAGGLIAISAGRRYYALWLGIATLFFTSRILDLALLRTPEVVHNLGGLVIATLVVVGVACDLPNFIHLSIDTLHLYDVNGF